MKRRSFLKLGAGAGAALTLPLFAGASVDPYEGKLYAVFNASGGWDTTYLMDPKGGDINAAFAADEIRSAGNIRYAPTAHAIAPGAMSNETFFERYASELLVVNGFDSSVANHQPCARYMGSGKLNSSAFPTFAALAASVHAPAAPLSFMTFGGYANTGNLIARNRVPTMNGLRSLATPDDAGSGQGYHSDYTFSRIDDALAGVAARPASLPRRERAQRFLYDAQESSKSLSRVLPHIPDSLPENRLLRQVEIALAAFSSGLCATANMSMGQFDSHANNDEDQLRYIPEFLAGIDHLLRRAEEIGIRHRLVVVIQSEMGRTPYYKDGGKDHWSVNSMMMLGPDITGGRVVGRTTIDPDTGRDQFAAHINPQTLEDDADGVRLRPEHIHQALREYAGVDTHANARRYDLGVAEDERLVGLFG